MSAAEASRLPSAENTRRLIERACPFKHADGGTGSKVPKPDHPDLVAAGERPAVGAHGQDPHVSLVAVQRGDLTCRAFPEDMPGKVTRVVLARIRDLVVQDILSTFELPVLDRRAGQAKLRSVKMPVSQPSVAVGEVGIAIRAGGLGLERHAVAAKPDRVLEHGRRQGDGEKETRRPCHGHQPAMPARPLAGPVEQARPASADRPVVEEAAQIIGQIGGRRITVGRDLGHRLQHDRLELDGDPRVDLSWWDRLLLDDPAQEIEAIVAGEGAREGQDLVEGGAQ